MAKEHPIRRKTHLHRMLIVMPRWGCKNVVERIVPVTLTHITFVDGPYSIDAGATA